MKLLESMLSEFYVTWFRFLSSWCFAFQLDRHSTIQRCAFKFHLAPRRRRSPRRPVWSPMRFPMRNRFVAVLATLCFFFFASQLFAWISPQRRRRPHQSRQFIAIADRLEQSLSSMKPFAWSFSLFVALSAWFEQFWWFFSTSLRFFRVFCIKPFACADSESVMLWVCSAWYFRCQKA